MSDSLEPRAIIVSVREEAGASRTLLIPGLGAAWSEMRPLAERLYGSVFILDLIATVDADPGPVSVEALAARAFDGMGSVGAVVGYSFGGLVALEMARIGGDSPPALIMIDSFPAQAFWSRRVWLYSMWTRLFQHLAALKGISLSQAVAEIRRRSGGLIRRLRHRAGRQTLTFTDDAAGRMSAAVSAYSPQTFVGKATLIESLKPAYNLPTGLIWRAVIANIERFGIPGDHLSLLDETEALAAKVNACLGAI